MKVKIGKILSSVPIQTVAQILLGAIFLYAGLSKFMNLDGFAGILKNYKMLPVNTVGIVSILLPLLEIICGALLILNIFPRQMAIILVGLLIVFILAIAINLVRGIHINCGCFERFLSTSKSKASVMDMKMTILRDTIFLIPGIIIIFFKKTIN
jgi:uncharacterized membrane protein YphA (DoxX/SURF4 family)